MKFDERALEVLHLNEPYLEFGHKQSTPHPKDGLFLYGPREKGKKTKDVRLGVVGTQQGISYFQTFAENLLRRVEVPPPKKGDKQDRLHLANFPGLEEAFGITFDPKGLVIHSIDARLLDRATRIVNHHEAVSKVVTLYKGAVDKHLTNDERIVDIWILIVPETVFERCRPESKRLGLAMEKGDFGKRQTRRAVVPLI